MLIDRTQANTEKFPTCQKKMDSAKQNEAEGRKGEEGVLQSLPTDILYPSLEYVNRTE